MTEDNIEVCVKDVTIIFFFRIHYYNNTEKYSEFCTVSLKIDNLSHKFIF